LFIAKYVEFVNSLPRKKVALWIKNLRLRTKMRRKNRKNVFRKIFFKFKESRRELKKFYFKIKKIDRKKRIKIKRKLLKKNLFSNV